MASVVDGEEDGTGQVVFGAQVNSALDTWLPGDNAPSSIHSDSSHNSDEMSLPESISGRNWERILSSGNDSDKADRKMQNLDLWKLPDSEADDGHLADIQRNMEDFQLNETLKSLMETKTPMLPSRTRTVQKPQSSATFVEPWTVARHDAGPGVNQRLLHSNVMSERWNSTTKYDSTQLPRHRHARRSAICDADYKTSVVTEFLNGSCEFPDESAVQSKHNSSVSFPVHEAVDAVICNAVGKNSSLCDVQSVPGERSGDAQSSAVVDSIHSIATKPLEYSAVSTVPDTDNLDSIIARYRNLREGSTADKVSADVSGSRVVPETVSYDERLTPNGVAMQSMAASDISKAATIVSESGNAAMRMPEPTIVGPTIVQQLADDVCQSDRVTVAFIGDDLCNDSFDDIRCGLQNISVDSTCMLQHTSSQQKGLSHV